MKFAPEFREEAARMVVEPPVLLPMWRGNWVRAYPDQHAENEPPLQVSERVRLREL